MLAASEIHRYNRRESKSRVRVPLGGCHFKCRRCDLISNDDDFSGNCVSIAGTFTIRLRIANVSCNNLNFPDPRANKGCK